MKQPLVLFAFFLLFLSGGCRKDLGFQEPEQADTLFPKPYLPLYPGSTWTYRNASDSSVFTWGAGGYVLAAANNSDYHSQHYFVPTWNGNPHFGYGFNTTFYSLSSGDYNAFTLELNEAPGSSWTYYLNAGDMRSNYYVVTRRTDSVGIVKTIGDTTYTNVIKIMENRVPGGTTSGFGAWSYYFAKDVGLIEKDVCSLSTGAPTPLFRLETYHINH